jgi:hypothetical protein
MQEHRPEEDDVFTDAPITDEKLKKALGDKRNIAVTLHKPGSRVTLPSGAEYIVQEDGSWRKV